MFTQGRIQFPLDVFSWKLISEDFSKFCRENSRWIKIRKKTTGTFHEDLCAFMIISRWILLRMRIVSDKITVKLKTHILCSTNFIRKSRAYEIMWKIPERTVAKAAQNFVTRTWPVLWLQRIYRSSHQKYRNQKRHSLPIILFCSQSVRWRPWWYTADSSVISTGIRLRLLSIVASCLISRPDGEYPHKGFRYFRQFL